MLDSRVVSVRVHQELLSIIDRLAAIKYPSRRGKEPSRSQLILDAIEHYIEHFDSTASNSSTEETEALIDAKLAPIQEKLSALESVLGEFVA
jgi:metal-responsive CopG/Arc/MetJ family transcriptional regulator